MHTLFWPPLSCIRMGLGPGTLPYWDEEPSESVLNWPHEGLSLPVSDAMYIPFLCLSMGVIWHLANPTAISVSCEERTESCCSNTRWVPVGQLPCIGCWKGPAGDWGLPQTTGVDLVLFLLCVSRALFHPGLYCVFLGISATKIQWEKVLRCLFLVIVNRSHCSSLKINNITNQGRKGRGRRRKNSVSCCLQAGERRWILEPRHLNEEWRDGYRLENC